LANELRQLREAAGLTIEQVATELDCSPSKVSRIETASVSPTPRDVRDILHIYGVTGPQLEELPQFAREARQRGGLYAEYRDIRSTATVAELEVEAETINEYSALLIPGVLQTADYARAVLRAIRVKPQPEDIERRVEFRLARQARLTREDPRALWVVLDEAALRRLVGGREVMRAQLEHLGEAAGWPSVTMQVLPFSAGAHAGMDGEFTIIRFREAADPDVVYIENSTRDLYLEDSDAIRRYILMFDHLRAAALDPVESATFITNVAKEL